MSLRATILLATLKRSGLSNTETLCEFLMGRMRQAGIECETVKLVEHDVRAGTYAEMGDGDAWPAIYDKLLASDLIVFATPIWWGSLSSELQRVIERLDAVHDLVMKGERSPLDGKAAGIVITGDSDGAQHVIAQVCNFCNAIGLAVPPYASLSVLWSGQAKGKDTPRETLLEKYEKDYTKTADTMIERLMAAAR